MAFDETLAERIRDELDDTDGITDRRMFGSLVFLLHGNMAFGVSGEDLIVRLGARTAAAALAEPGTRIFDGAGRPMPNWVLVDGAQLDGDALGSWLRRGLDFAGSLPPR